MSSILFLYLVFSGVWFSWLDEPRVWVASFEAFMVGFFMVQYISQIAILLRFVTMRPHKTGSERDPGYKRSLIVGVSTKLYAVWIVPAVFTGCYVLFAVIHIFSGSIIISLTCTMSLIFVSDYWHTLVLQRYSGYTLDL